MPDDQQTSKAKRTKDPHPDDRFIQWKKDDFIREVRIRAREQGLDITVPVLRALVNITLDVLKDVASKGIVINFYGWMRWGPKSHRACTFTRQGKEIYKAAYTVPFARFSPTYRNRVKEAHR